jgi:hypothetical protein
MSVIAIGSSLSVCYVGFPAFIGTGRYLGALATRVGLQQLQPEMINAVRFVDFCTGDPRRRRG